MLPHFDYLDIIWSKANITKLNELDIIYKKVAKIALDFDIQERSILVYKEMKWLPLQIRRQLHLTAYNGSFSLKLPKILKEMKFLRV